jgi:SAM-dependent methyltransferase
MLNYRDVLEIQRFNLCKSKSLHKYFSSVYSVISREIKLHKKIIEVGSGAGVSQLFLDQEVLRTDYYEFPEYGVLGNIDMNNLPYENESFDAALVLDSLHHSASPAKALDELIRIVRPSGKVIIFEPFVSFFSYLPYKIFHDEKTSWKLPVDREFDLRNKLPEEGDQGVSRSIIQSLVPIGNEGGVKIIYTSWLSFFATGGINKPWPFGETFVSMLIRIERLIPQRIMKLLSSRVFIIISK